MKYRVTRYLTCWTEVEADSEEEAERRADGELSRMMRCSVDYYDEVEDITEEDYAD